MKNWKELIIVLFLVGVVSAVNEETCTYGGGCASSGDCDLNMIGNETLNPDCDNCLSTTGDDGVTPGKMSKSGETEAHGGYGSSQTWGSNVMECCGDDNGENYNTFIKDSEVEWSDSTGACCDNPDDCIVGSLCYLDGTGYANKNKGGNDNITFCKESVWYDCDINESSCETCSDVGYCVYGGECWVEAGEVVGEYSDISTLGCCGDDVNEKYTRCLEHDVSPSGQNISWNCDDTVDACCDGGSACVGGVGENIICSTWGTAENLNPKNNDTISQCWFGQWADCDYNSDVCGNCSTYIPYTNGQENWISIGSSEDSVFGEYSNLTHVECCGDDYPETYQHLNISNLTMDSYIVSNMSDIACCSTPWSCVNNSICYTNTTTIDLDEDGDNDICLDTVWYDCLTANECNTSNNEFCLDNNCLFNLTVNITHPINGSTYYRNTLELNTTVTKNTSEITCEYWITGYSRNNYTYPTQQVTFPQGENTVNIECLDTNGIIGTDTLTFEVILFYGNRLKGNNKATLIAFLTLLSILTIAHNKIKK